MAGKNDKTKATAEPWRGIMKDVAKMMKEAVKEADHIVAEYQRSQAHKLPTSKTIEMAVAIFEATVTAEAGRRMIEAQKGNTLVGGKLIAVGKDGRRLQM